MTTKIMRITIEENGVERELDVSQYDHFEMDQENGITRNGPTAEPNGCSRMMLKLWTGSLTYNGFKTDN